MKKLVLLALIYSGYSSAQIQTQDFYSFRMDNMFQVNPAYANYSKGVLINLGGIAQTQGVDFNNKNAYLGISSKISKNQGLGGSVITDMRGAFQTTKATISYAYTAPFNESSNLTFGLSSGIMNYGMNSSRIEGYEYIDQTDPTLNRNYYNRTQFVAGIGLLFRWKELDVSFSLPHLITTNNPANAYINTVAEYRFKTGQQFKVAPSLVYQHLPVLGNLFTGYVKGSFKDVAWLKVGYQSNNSLHTMVGFNLDNFGIGYGFRFNNSTFNNLAFGLHELSISFKIGNKKEKGLYNPTLVEIDHRLTKLQTRKITPENRPEIIEEVRRIKQLMENTSVNTSTPQAAEEATEYLRKIETKLIELQAKLNEK
ncbi:PorP/SprF family type IX secretion system membrane protein [Fluviicola taffensis]|uniref:Putative membrane protein n=1 Tax=Fluviicola taffensis (strain DSM 16823 / NCIMB 13979 / RW262) TaxID=755732 RepID=F2IHU2_FLUTR|nr:PorP/SprF family type IX secretion system membrane protein [Fluviicola taffensis]AEA45901.1 putative membrane protein [Fluviicola taffensis DSM 16823]